MDELQEHCLEVIASSSVRNGPEVLLRCHTTRTYSSFAEELTKEWATAR